jgi:hypothetical protein
LSVDEQRLLGRITGGSLAALTAAQIRTLLGTASFVLGSDADGDMYYRASSLLARLAKGAANTSLFMKADGTIPEWAVGHKVINITHNCTTASGHFHVSGFGFPPSAAFILTGIDGYPIVSIGWTDGTSKFEAYNAHLATANAWYVDSSYIGACVQSGSDSVILVFGAWESDGLRVDFTKTGSPSGTLEISVFGKR